MENTTFLLITFGYVLTFIILGLVAIYFHIPKEEGFEYYRKSRRTLSIACVLMSIYCVIRLFMQSHHGDYADFWILVTFTLIFSWLTYAALLFLMETPRYLTKNFILDGGLPGGLMLATGGIGMFIPKAQEALMILFGVVFGLKCGWMFYACIREYRKCEIDLSNFYDQKPDIRWMRSLIYMSLVMSAGTIAAFYIPAVRIFYYIAVPFIYCYMVLKISSFAPEKIDQVRNRNLQMLKKQKAESQKSKEISDKVAHLVDRWVAEKKFCQTDLNIKDVAFEMGTNHNYLSSYLNNSLGITFQVWLNTLRIEESKLLLAGSERMSIEEAGARVGIPQNYNYSRWFKIVTGTTPYQYRKASLSKR